MNSREAILSFVRKGQCDASREQIESITEGGYWNDDQALALLDSLNLDGARPKWKQEYVNRLHDWCSAHERDVRTTKGQLDFVAYQLLNTHEGVGRELHRAKTYEEAQEALEPYVKLLEEQDV